MVTRTGGAPRGATWGADQTIVFATTDAATGLMSVSASGGDPKILTKPNSKHGEVEHLFPSYLPNGKGVLFTITKGASADNAEIAVLDLQTGSYKTVVRGGSSAEYVNGYVVYAVGATLRAVRFDQDRFEAVGDPVPVIDQVAMTNNGAAQFSTSRTGSLVHLSGGVAGTAAPRSLVWVDRHGAETPIKEAPLRGYGLPRLSGDDSRLAVSIDDQQRDIYVYDFRTQALRQITFTAAQDGGPVWYPNGERLLFFSQRDGPANLYAQRADGVGAAERITDSRNQQFIPTISPDGKAVVLVEQGITTGNLDLMLLRLDAAAGQPAKPATKTEPFIASMAPELHPEISPDGRWIAYVAEQGGRRQVFVQPFPSLQGTWKVSGDDGGDRPAWSRGGKELFYATLKGTIMAVAYDDMPTFAARTPVRLFDWPTIATPGQGRTFDVSRDGKRFLMIKEGASSEGSKAPPAAITVSLNWIEELREKLPPK
jgi:eukaryotic-like serine/threonine-protein kinase